MKELDIRATVPPASLCGDLLLALNTVGPQCAIRTGMSRPMVIVISTPVVLILFITSSKCYFLCGADSNPDGETLSNPLSAYRPLVATRQDQEQHDQGGNTVTLGAGTSIYALLPAKTTQLPTDALPLPLPAFNASNYGQMENFGENVGAGAGAARGQSVSQRDSSLAANTPGYGLLALVGPALAESRYRSLPGNRASSLGVVSDSTVSSSNLALQGGSSSYVELKADSQNANGPNYNPMAPSVPVVETAAVGALSSYSSLPHSNSSDINAQYRSI